MKRTLFAIAALACLAIAPATRAADFSVDFFYNNISGGSWVDVGDYGYCWQPDIAVSDSNWRPYADGYWAYTDLGWTWVSYEDFGWATYHYGRWAKLSEHGWVWVPGRNEDLEWGPAWVSWRTGGEYVGWAPLPPETVVYEGRPVSGQIDVEFNIGPACYNFVDVRYIGAPVLRERIIAPAQNVTYINQTVNVTNITYKNKVVYNYGPDVNVINQHAERPIQRLKLERQENVDVTAAAKSGGLFKPQGDKLVVAAPMHIRKAQNEVAPPTVKTRVAKANIDRGWSVAGDEKAQNDLREKIKTQDPKKVAPIGSAATGQVATEASVGASAIPGPSAAAGAKGAAATSADAFEKGKGKRGRKGNQPLEQNAAASPVQGTSPSTSPATADAGKRKGKRGQPMEQNPPAIGPETGATTGATQNDNDIPGGGKHKAKHEEHAAGNMPPSPKPMNSQSASGGATNNAADDTANRREQRRAQRRAGRMTDQSPGESMPSTGNAPATNNSPNGSQASTTGGGKHKGEHAQVTKQGDGQPGDSPNEGQNQQHGGKGNKPEKNNGEESPAPSPQQ